MLVKGTFNRLSGAAVGLFVVGVVVMWAEPDGASAAPQLVCRKVIAENVTGEGQNALDASRVKCAPGEMLTGGTCYPETRPEDDGSCQTSAMGIIQPIIDHATTTEEAFFTCLQTGGSNCPVASRTRAMAICCKIADEAPAAKK
jgi:hypothetical protein